MPTEGEVLRVYSKYVSLIQYKQVTAYSLVKVQQKQDKFQSMDKQMVRAIQNQQTEVWIKPMSPALQDRFLIPGPPVKSLFILIFDLPKKVTGGFLAV